MSSVQLSRRSALLPALALAVLVGVLVGGVLISANLAPRREKVVYHRRPAPEVVQKGGLNQLGALGTTGSTGDPLMDCVAKYLRDHGGDEITRTQGFTSPAFAQLSLQAQLTCTAPAATRR